MAQQSISGQGNDGQACLIQLLGRADAEMMYPKMDAMSAVE